jgi:hypothetical protein
MICFVVQKEFEKLRIARTKEHFEQLQVPLHLMVRPPPQPKILHCYEVGTCSDGGVAVVSAFSNSLADVRYILDGKQEKNIALARLTTIPMPHRGKSAKLRERNQPALVVAEERKLKSKFAQMTPMDVLKWGLLYKRNVPKVEHYPFIYLSQLLNPNNDM